MKILIVGGIQKPTDEMVLTDIKASVGVLWSYFLRKELAKLGIETVYVKATDAGANEEKTREWYDDSRHPIPDADHMICVEQRAFANRCPVFHEIFRKKIPGMLGAICDHNKTGGPEDVLFHCLGWPKRPQDVKVGWAASAEHCKPMQSQSTLRLLVDHPYYAASDADLTNPILASCVAQGCDVRHFIDGAVILVETDTPLGRYTQRRVQWIDAVAEYGRAHAFFVTHPESMGYSVMEAAMAGALIVAPAGYIQQEYLSQFRHIEWEGTIPWAAIYERIGPDQCREKALKFNRWAEIAEIVAGTFQAA